MIDNAPEALRKLVSKLDHSSLVACYGADPTGYDTHRQGFGCQVGTDHI